MSNQLHLYVSNFSSPQEIFDDDYNNGNKQEVLLEVPGDVPALLWIPMFKNCEWQDVFDKEQFKEDEAGIEEQTDYIIKMPINRISQAIKLLEEAEENISKYFSENGGVKCIVDDLVEILKSSDMEYIMFNPMCGDFDYSSQVGNEIIISVLKIVSGDFSINKNNLANLFGLTLTKKRLFFSKPVQFERFSEALYDSDHQVELINLYSLSGVVDDSLSFS